MPEHSIRVHARRLKFIEAKFKELVGRRLVNERAGDDIVAEMLRLERSVDRAQREARRLLSLELERRHGSRTGR